MKAVLKDLFCKGRLMENKGDRQNKAEKKRRKEAIEKSVQMIYDKAEARIKEGCNAFQAEWQATLELMLLGMEKPLRDNPGQLHALQISGQEEWDFYVEVLVELDLPPDTCAVLITPSAAKDMPIPTPPEIEASGITPWQRDAYTLIISHCQDRETIMQVSLPGLESAGIDVFEDGKHLADYTYNSVEECLKDLSRTVWIYLKPKEDWTEDKMLRYTENWFSKIIHTHRIEEARIHQEWSYIHNPELLKSDPLETVFRVIKATIPKEYDSLDYAIEITNDLNRDMDTGEAVVTLDGVLHDRRAECQALFNRIVIEIDEQLNTLESIEGVKFPHRNLSDSKYSDAFEKTAREVYEIVTRRPCPEYVRLDDQDSLDLGDSDGITIW